MEVSDALHRRYQPLASFPTDLDHEGDRKKLALRMADDYGCVGLVVDAKPDAVDFYRQYGFISVDVVEGQSDARPAPIPMFLAIRAIRAAFGAQED